MIDFSKATEELNSYKGSEKKKTLIYENKKYLVKFPDPIREKNKNISYINNAFSEYVGSNIFNIVGFETQKTVLGTYMYNQKEKIVCACEDFTNRNNTLYEFENLALSTNPDKKIETELVDILEVIKDTKVMIPNNTEERFWEMFVIDGLIGNTDRHNGNWGFLVNSNTREIILAPIYDKTILKIFPKIDIKKINEFIDNMPCISLIRKEFYKKIISIRYGIIRSVYKKISEEA